MGEFEKKIMQEDLIINYHYGPMYKYGKEVPREYDDELHFESAISKEDVMDIIEEAKKEFPTAEYWEPFSEDVDVGFTMIGKSGWKRSDNKNPKAIKLYSTKQIDKWFLKWFAE